MGVHKIPLRKNIFESLYSGCSKIITPFFLKTSLTPNQITIISGMLGIIGAFLLTSQNKTMLFFAGILIQLFLILDLVDGDIARMKKMQSLFGKWLDRFFDKLNDFLLILGVSVGLYWRTNNSSALYLGIILMGIVFLIQNSMLANKIIFDDINIKSNGNKDYDGAVIPVRFNYFSLKTVARLIATHLLLEHCTFLFLLSVFIFIDFIEVGLWFLTIHAALTMIFITTSNFYQLSKYHSQERNK